MASENLHFTSEALRSQVVFVARIQHELRTPITTIIGYSKELLLHETNQERTEGLEHILVAGQSMLAAVDNFINEQTLSRTQSRECLLSPHLHHDLRNAVHVMQMYSEMLLDDVRGDPQVDYAPDLRRIRRAGDEIMYVLEALSAGANSPDAQMANEALCSLGALKADNDGNCSSGTVLLVEDNENIRELLQRQVERLGYVVVATSNGRDALCELKENHHDVVLLDLLMPEMNGYQVLAVMRSDEELSYIPVIVISAFENTDSIERCIQLGADEYLPKTYNPALLKARLSACLEKKRYRDRERQYLEKIEEEKRKSDRLLQSILPTSIAERLKGGETRIAELFPEATVLFADLVGFTEFAASTPPERLISCLNEIFIAFDELVDSEGLEKIKTIGDAYMVAGGLPEPRPDHAQAVTRLGVEMLRTIGNINRGRAHRFQLRVGIHSGPVVAGVIGRSKFSYDLWGDTVNVASRMETDGVPGWIQVSKATHDLVHDSFHFEERGSVPVQGKGTMTTYLLKDE